MTMAYTYSRSNRTYSSTSSSSSSSDEPLIRYREDSKNDSDGHYDNLIRQIKHTCDICDRVFTDRYSAIIHNNTHMIIPLIKISVVQCHKCYKLEPTKQDLYLHMILEHRDAALQEKVRNKIVFEEDLLDVHVKVEDDDDDDNDDDDDINNDMLSIVECEDEDENCFRSLNKFGLHQCKFCNDVYSSRYKLLQHNIEHIMINTRNENLCGHCEKYFETGFDLDRHLLIEHGGIMINMFENCFSCNLPYFDLVKHYKFYHLPPPVNSNEETVRCQTCHMDINKSGIKKHWLDHQDTLHICDMCKLFLKNSNILRYAHIGILSIEGKRSKCQKCGHQFFDLNIIKKIRYNTVVKTYKQPKVKTALNNSNNYKINKNKLTKKPMSNMERLKNIQNRLKVIKHLNKF